MANRKPMKNDKDEKAAFKFRYFCKLTLSAP